MTRNDIKAKHAADPTTPSSRRIQRTRISSGAIVVTETFLCSSPDHESIPGCALRRTPAAAAAAAAGARAAGTRIALPASFSLAPLSPASAEGSSGARDHEEIGMVAHSHQRSATGNVLIDVHGEHSPPLLRRPRCFPLGPPPRQS